MRNNDSGMLITISLIVGVFLVITLIGNAMNIRSIKNNLNSIEMIIREYNEKGEYNNE